MHRRWKFLALAGVGLVALWGVFTGLEMWLTRDVIGPACPEFTRAEVDAAGLDFTPRVTIEKQLPPAHVRAAQNEPDPDCFISQSAFRCTLVGPTTAEISQYGKRRYFQVTEGQQAVLFGKQGISSCVIVE